MFFCNFLQQDIYSLYNFEINLIFYTNEDYLFLECIILIDFFL